MLTRERLSIIKGTLKDHGFLNKKMAEELIDGVEKLLPENEPQAEAPKLKRGRKKVNEPVD